MARHTFSFDGGEELTTLGAVWFVSYSWFNKIDTTHLNWQNVSTYDSRISTYKRTQEYHMYWLKQIIHMNECNLDKNKIGLKGSEVIAMAKKLLQE